MSNLSRKLSAISPKRTQSNPYLFTLTTLQKDVIFSSSKASQVRIFLEEWKNRSKELLLIHVLSVHSTEYIVDDLEEDDDNGKLGVFRALISNSMEKIMYEGFALTSQLKAIQQLQVISSDFSDYETFIWSNPKEIKGKSNLVKDRHHNLIKSLSSCSEDDCNDCDCECDCED
jgi:hypothetical protein